MSHPAAAARADVYDACRPELVGYATKLVLRVDVAEEIAQEAALRLLQTAQLPDDPLQLRAWLFTVVTNLGIDYLRRHSTWREATLITVRDAAERDAEFVAASGALRGSPEVKTIAREHLAVCFCCTLRNLSPQRSAALLLVEVYGFAVAEAAAALGATPIQVKNWLQQARRTLTERYQRTCALINKQGICHQCVELGAFFNGSGDDPLRDTARDLDARLQILRDQRQTALGPWHTRMLRLIDDVLDAS